MSASFQFEKIADLLPNIAREKYKFPDFESTRLINFCQAKNDKKRRIFQNYHDK